MMMVAWICEYVEVEKSGNIYKKTANDYSVS
jgi:hypothetical protein